ncbi:uncharacterized protein RSE6_05130 [Rhynchosporium secalis]|uniref:Uncharacterized protein n=1 Tax=Rhynchosporium secalis TaxID=38038 RepID=A0A1E1M702_RHYSE|nr:uncharacterized protein RSE6_05130 [Rhynchosporium secalis]
MILKQGFNITGDLGSGFSEDHLFRPSPDYAGPNTMMWFAINVFYETRFSLQLVTEI